LGQQIEDGQFLFAQVFPVCPLLFLGQVLREGQQFLEEGLQVVAG
jgi:hypothetical protein